MGGGSPHRGYPEVSGDRILRSQRPWLARRRLSFRANPGSRPRARVNTAAVCAEPEPQHAPSKEPQRSAVRCRRAKPSSVEQARLPSCSRKDRRAVESRDPVEGPTTLAWRQRAVARSCARVGSRPFASANVLRCWPGARVLRPCSDRDVGARQSREVHGGSERFQAVREAGLRPASLLL